MGSDIFPNPAMSDTGQSPDMTRPPDQQFSGSYADKVKTNIKWDNRLKRNVLEIILDSDKSEYTELSDDLIEKLFRTIGINTKNQVEGFYRKNNTIFAWLSAGIDLDRFCRSESIQISSSVRTKFIRPSGKKEVTVRVCGLDFNTPDSFVMEYLNKFGKVVTDSVIYDKHKEGPFAEKFNGDRRYSVDFTCSNINMGSFHLIDGARVKIFFNGNRKTCARCHQTEDLCKGSAIAAVCEANNGPRISLLDHMKNLWKTVNFTPANFELKEKEIAKEMTKGDKPIRDRREFSPNIKRPNTSEEQKDNYIGVAINNLPKDIPRQDLVSFLHSKGLSNDAKEDEIVVNDTKKGVSVVVTSMDKETVETLVEKIDFSKTRTKFFQRPLYCRALLQMSPSKTDNLVADDIAEVENPIIGLVGANGEDKGDGKHHKSSCDSNDFEWEDDSSIMTPVMPSSSKFFKKVVDEKASDDDSESGSAGENQIVKQKKLKNRNKKRGRNSSGKKGKEEKKSKN